jgi:glycerol kinase
VILALDQGTTSSRAIVFDAAGAVVASAQRELRQIYPQPGWVEHDPREIASTQLEVAAEVVKNFDIAAIGITNQRETTILWDRATGEPIARLVIIDESQTGGTFDRPDDGRWRSNHKRGSRSAISDAPRVVARGR